MKSLQLILVLGIAGCSVGPTQKAPSLYSQNTEVARSKIEAAIPIGTDVSAAREIMETDGWRCSDYTDQAGKTSLFCVYSWDIDKIVSGSTDVHLYYSDDKITDIEVRTFGTGP